MAKFHIGKNGPAKCRALVRNCPLGGRHFEHEEDARKHYEYLMEREQAAEAEQERLRIAEEAAEKVATIIEKSEGEWLDNINAIDARRHDVLPDGRVISSVEQVSPEQAEKITHRNIKISFVTDEDDFPPGFSLEHFPQNRNTEVYYNADDVIMHLWRPPLADDAKLSSPGREWVAVATPKNLLPGDMLSNGKVISSIHDSGEKIYLTFQPWSLEFGEKKREAYSYSERFHDVFFRKPR